MRIFGLSLGTVGKITTGVGNVLSFAAMVVLPLLVKKDTVSNCRHGVVVTYDDVVMAVMNSGMTSTDKSKITAIIPREGTSTLYKAMINVVESNMLSTDKIETIKHICRD